MPLILWRQKDYQAPASPIDAACVAVVIDVILRLYLTGFCHRTLMALGSISCQPVIMHLASRHIRPMMITSPAELSPYMHQQIIGIARRCILNQLM